VSTNWENRIEDIRLSGDQRVGYQDFRLSGKTEIKNLYLIP
jgi:hypothetical protein